MPLGSLDFADMSGDPTTHRPTGWLDEANPPTAWFTVVTSIPKAGDAVTALPCTQLALALTPIFTVH
jgi:hypothetical protein